MARSKTFKTDREFNITGADNILDLEIREPGIKAKLLNNTGIFARGQLKIIFRLSTSNNHLARCKNESSYLGLTDTYNDSGKTLHIAC